MDKLNVAYKLINENNEGKIAGSENSNIKLIEEVLGYKVVLTHDAVLIKDSANVEEVTEIFSTIEELLNNSFALAAIDFINIIASIKNNTIDKLKEIYLNKELIVTLHSGKPIYPKTINQALYLQNLKNMNMVFGIGPAGTGKTYIAVLYAANLLKLHLVNKIVLVRPVVEAGEKLGYLPGDVKEKIDPYLIPLYDCLEEVFSKQVFEKMLEKGTIEIAPLAYMRGRTLNNSIIILDEAQNTTRTQMKMFLTRLGFDSKMIITGDVTQIDLHSKRNSGLIEATRILDKIKGIGFVKFEKCDVMRNPLVYKIIQRYEENDKN